jgi:hypothetical protein
MYMATSMQILRLLVGVSMSVQEFPKWFSDFQFTPRPPLKKKLFLNGLK